MNNMAQGLAMFDREHRLVVCNKLYAEMYRLTPEQVAATAHGLYYSKEPTGEFLYWTENIDKRKLPNPGPKLGARGAMLSTLGNLRGALGSLDRIARFLKITGFIRAVPGFVKTPPLMDGASELLRDIFGPDLLPARSAIGVSALPGNASVEIESVVLLES